MGTGDRSFRELCDGIGELADCFEFGKHVQGQDDVPFILDRRDQIHHGERIQLEIAGETYRLPKHNALLVERIDELKDAGEDLGAVGHGGSLTVARAACQRNGGGCGQPRGKWYSNATSAQGLPATKLDRERAWGGQEWGERLNQ